MGRSYYSGSIKEFLATDSSQIFGKLSRAHEFDSGTRMQAEAWEDQIIFLKDKLSKAGEGHLFFEFQIPRMGKRVDNILIIDNCIFVIEFKVGESKFAKQDINQVIDYCLDLENFHSTSHDANLIPVLVCTKAKSKNFRIQEVLEKRGAVCVGGGEFLGTLLDISKKISGARVDVKKWEYGEYKPTPSIIEAAVGLFNNHSVEEIAQSGADDVGLAFTTDCLAKIVEDSKVRKKKTICFVTGVPGAGKTLVGLDLVTNVMKHDVGLDSVFLTGNRPLIRVLVEALATNKVAIQKLLNDPIKKDDAKREAKKLIQNIHEYRRESIKGSEAPSEHVVIFDEAQRAWSEEHVRKKTNGKVEKEKAVAEAETLISTMDRHKDWCVIVALVGGGQEINNGELGIQGWLSVLRDKYPTWQMYFSPELIGSKYYISNEELKSWAKKNGNQQGGLHLKVPMRSFKAENVSKFVEELLEGSENRAKSYLDKFIDQYPILITRDFEKAKDWIRTKKRGSERSGVMASSHARRLRPFGVDVKSKISPEHWFLKADDDIRSSSFLEEIATEYDVQGLEIDWAIVGWDANLRYNENGWEYYNFKGTNWTNIKCRENRTYLLNSYRVLLTRARQGMIIFLPEGDESDETRKAQFYEGTYQYLKSLGIKELL